MASALWIFVGTAVGLAILFSGAGVLLLVRAYWRQAKGQKPPPEPEPGE